MKSSKVAVPVVIVAAFFLALSLSLLYNDGGSGFHRESADSTRFGDLQQVQNLLQLYYDKCGYYPGTPQTTAACGSYVQIIGWQNLTRTLTLSGLGILRVPNDPEFIARNNWPPYPYGTNASGTHYVIGATFSSAHPELIDGASGTIDGINCAPPIYCLEQ